MKNKFPGAVPGLCCALLCGMFCVSCSLEETLPPPYAIGRPSCAIGPKEGYFLCAGIEFEFYNLESREIRSIAVSAMVYDRVTLKNPFIGSNRITSGFTGAIPGNSKADLAISLDPYIFALPSQPYIVDFFYVARIDYADGSCWTDADGTYFTGSDE